MQESKTTVHIIMQAHLDPVWLWSWQAGLDEALATCRTACDLLDQYPDFIFTSAEAWRHQQIERLDPALFARIRKHVEAGRWEIVGGWWLQPDCNFPSGFAMEQQIDLGLRYFRERFGVLPEVGYNVDSFGHAATLPGLLRAAGQRFYVMMRPQDHEMELPARVFRWRGYADTPEVVVFRIAGAYCTGGDRIDPEHVKRALTTLPPGIEHTMCFIGVGDHGGGATAKLIEWVRANAGAFDGCQLVFSSPPRFFRALEKQAAALPLVTGELQHHAIGCYTVHRGIKTRVRRAEHRVRQAELAARAWGDQAAAVALAKAWEPVCFNHFHDILGGTCIPSAYPLLYDQLGGAVSQADDVLHAGFRRELVKLPGHTLQQMVYFNASDTPFDGFIEHEPWMRWPHWEAATRAIDERGLPVPSQLLAAEACGANHIPRVLLRLKLEPCEQRIIRIDPTGGGTMPSRVRVDGDELANDGGVAAALGKGVMALPELPNCPLPRLTLIDDLTDNWTHVIDRYADGPGARPMWQAAETVDRGPLMASLIQNGRIGESGLRAEWRVYAGEPFVELRLTVLWCEARKLLKLVVPLLGAPTERRDGILGGGLVRANDGKERPIQDWVQCGHFGVVTPDVYALDGTPERLRFTLLRSPIQTHHDPHSGITPRGVIADQGRHEFLFRFCGGKDVTPEWLARCALMCHRPPLAADVTRGMPRG